MRLLGTFVVVVTLAGCSGAAPSDLIGAGAQSSADSTTSHIAHGADQTLSFSTTTTLQEFGKGLWEGYVSFDASASGCIAPTTCYDYAIGSYDSDAVTVVDGSGASYALTSAKSIHFDRLPLPVKLQSAITN
jgi:hypothetical protein